jgi:Flp pilus assembly protein TadB
VTGVLLLSSLCLVAGGLIVGNWAIGTRRPALNARLTRGRTGTAADATLRWGPDAALPAWARNAIAGYSRDLKRAGGDKTLREFLTDKALLTIALPAMAVMLTAAATGRLPSPVVLLLLAAVGFALPDLALRREIRARRETIFLDLPDAISVMALSLGAGQSLRQALELAARDCHGPLGHDLTRALSLARREGHPDRDALVLIARDTGEPTFARFAELLAAKESPYLDFLRTQAANARAEQARYLERAADRAYLAMHAPIAPLLAVMVLLVAYGLLRFLTQAV